MDKRADGLVLVCDELGCIRQVVHDHLGVTGSNTVGQALASVLDRGSAMKAQNFLDEVRTRGSTVAWEMSIERAGELESLHFAGAMARGAVLVIGSTSPQEVTRLYDDLTAINNEQMNALRTAMKDAMSQIGRRADQDQALYDELSRLNGELATKQRELSKKNAELEMLMEQRNQFLGMAAHDLRNPMGAILNYSQFLIDEVGAGLDETHREFLETIHAQSEFMLNLVNQLLDISKIESGKIELNPFALDFAEFVERNAAVNQALARKKGIRFEFSCDQGLPELEFDPVRMDQVVNNLLSNAMKFSPARSLVRVRVARDEEDVVLSVIDQGPGIPLKEQEGLFKPFGRTSVQSTGGEPSTGLGLAIARKIIEAHRGRVWVESEPGMGSTFRVALPAPRTLRRD